MLKGTHPGKRTRACAPITDVSHCSASQGNLKPACYKAEPRLIPQCTAVQYGDLRIMSLLSADDVLLASSSGDLEHAVGWFTHALIT